MFKLTIRKGTIWVRFKQADYRRYSVPEDRQPKEPRRTTGIESRVEVNGKWYAFDTVPSEASLRRSTDKTHAWLAIVDAASKACEEQLIGLRDSSARVDRGPTVDSVLRDWEKKMQGRRDTSAASGRNFKKGESESSIKRFRLARESFARFFGPESPLISELVQQDGKIKLLDEFAQACILKPGESREEREAAWAEGRLVPLYRDGRLVRHHLAMRPWSNDYTSGTIKKLHRAAYMETAARIWTPELQGTDKKDTILNDDQILCVLTELPPAHAAITALRLATGVRGGEVYRMAARFDGQGYERGALRIDGTKNASSRRNVPLYSEVVRLVMKEFGGLPRRACPDDYTRDKDVPGGPDGVCGAGEMRPFEGSGREGTVHDWPIDLYSMGAENLAEEFRHFWSTEHGSYETIARHNPSLFPRGEKTKRHPEGKPFPINPTLIRSHFDSAANSAAMPANFHQRLTGHTPKGAQKSMSSAAYDRAPTDEWFDKAREFMGDYDNRILGLYQTARGAEAQAAFARVRAERQRAAQKRSQAGRWHKGHGRRAAPKSGTRVQPRAAKQ